MQKFDIHVCLVSDQATPNLVPILAKDFRPKEVILLVTESMKERAKWLAEVLRNNGIQSVHPIPLESEYDMSLVEDKILELFDKHEYESKNMALNITGGTKLMSIAAYQMFRDLGYPTFYFTAKSNEVLLLDSKETFVLTAEKLKLEHYLQVHGYKPKNEICRTTQYGYSDLTQELVQHRLKFFNEISLLNHQIGLVEPHDLRIEVPQGQNLHNMRELLNLFEDKALLRQDGEYLIFPDQEAKQYVQGGWFEEYVYDLVKKLPNIQDCALNLQIEHHQKGTHQPNELDIAVLSNNVLHVIECKTANYSSRHNREENKARDALYKLETLKKLGGLRTQATLVSYRPLPAGVRDRAKGASITLIEERDLSGLRTRLKNLLEK